MLKDPVITHTVRRLYKHDIHLWFIDTAYMENTRFCEAYLTVLSQEEVVRANNFKSKKHRLQFIVTRAALRFIIAHYLGMKSAKNIRFYRTKLGKPYIISSMNTLFFNVSHSQDKVVLGFSASQNIGVDIEFVKKQRDIFKIAQHYYHANEKNLAMEGVSLTPEQQFYTLWALKEAYVKAKGGAWPFLFVSFILTLVIRRAWAL